MISQVYNTSFELEEKGKMGTSYCWKLCKSEMACLYPLDVNTKSNIEIDGYERQVRNTTTDSQLVLLHGFSFNVITLVVITR